MWDSPDLCQQATTDILTKSCESLSKLRHERKEKFALFSDLNGSLLRRQPRAEIATRTPLKTHRSMNLLWTHAELCKSRWTGARVIESGGDGCVLVVQQLD